MSIRIIGDGISAQKLRIIADIVNAKVEYSPTSTKDALPHRTAILVTPEGVTFPSSVALRYLGRMRPDLGLYGQSFLEASLVDKALRTTEFNILIPLETITCLSGLETAEKAKNDIRSSVKEQIEPQLLNSTYLLGERITIADIDLALCLNEAVKKEVLDLSKFPCTKRWMSLILNNPNVKKYCHREQQQDTKNAKELLQVKKKTEDDLTKLVTGEQNKNVVGLPKESIGTYQEGAGNVVSQQDVEEFKKPKPGKTNALDSLPPTSFVLDEWKRVYSNCKDLKGIAMPWFWSHFDKEGWSIWYCRYDKLEGENTLSYTTANMLGGFLQRLDSEFRKYSFAVNNVVGEDNNFDILGVWLVRGQELPLELTSHPSFPFFNFRKLDDVQANKQLIEDYWCNDESVEGRPISSCKVWK